MNETNTPQPEQPSNLRSCLTVVVISVLCVVLPALLLFGARRLLGWN